MTELWYLLFPANKCSNITSKEHKKCQNSMFIVDSPVRNYYQAGRDF